MSCAKDPYALDGQGRCDTALDDQDVGVLQSACPQGWPGPACPANTFMSDVRLYHAPIGGDESSYGAVSQAAWTCCVVVLG